MVQKKQYKKIALLFVCGWFSIGVFSQNIILTKEQAVKALFENNYDLKTSQNELKIAANNASIFNAGYLPTLNLNSSASFDLDQQKLVSQSGVVNHLDNVDTKSISTSLQAQYLVFNGFNRKYIYQQFQEQLHYSELESKWVTEQALLDVLTLYYQTAQQSENIQILSQTLEVSKQRLMRISFQYDYGQVNKLAVLNAQVDVDQDSINYLKNKQILDVFKRNLSLLIGDTTLKNFDVETEVVFQPIPSLAEFQNMIAQNTSYAQLEKALEISALSIKSVASARYPSVYLNTSYGWNHANNDETATLSTFTQHGFGAGLTLSWPIFDGGKTKIKTQNAQLQYDNLLISKEKVKHQLDNQLQNIYADYQNKLVVKGAEEVSLQTATLNYQRTEEQFKLGQMSSVAYRQAQTNLLRAQLNLLAAKYDAKIAELQLWQLVGVVAERL